MKNKKMTSIRFDQELLDIIKAEAAEQNRSVTNLIEYILWEYFKNKDK